MELREKVALALLNDDRNAAGFPSVPNRDKIPDSEGYLRNADAAIAIVEAATFKRAIGAAMAVCEIHLANNDYEENLVASGAEIAAKAIAVISGQSEPRQEKSKDRDAQ